MRSPRSLLYIPGNAPGMLQHASIFGADCAIADLEDSVALSEKDAARRLVAHFLRVLDFGNTVSIVRVNGADTPFFEDDLREIAPLRPDALRIPKCESPEDIAKADEALARVETANGMPIGSVAVHAMVETALGVERAFEIASASPRVMAISLGGQDLLADLGVQKTAAGWELFYARGRVVTAARAAGIPAFDTVWTDVADAEGLAREAKQIVEMGFSGKAVIHPSQIDVVHEAFRPDARELRRAARVVRAAEDAARCGKGVVAVDGRMVDAPIVARARRLMEMGTLYGMRGDES